MHDSKLGQGRGRFYTEWALESTSGEGSVQAEPRGQGQLGCSLESKVSADDCFGTSRTEPGDRQYLPSEAEVAETEAAWRAGQARGVCHVRTEKDEALEHPSDSVAWDSW